MSFFIKEENVRPGNRGGRDQFKWDNIRLLNNKDRESYLGVTQSIGFLDKGGKWRKRDWWLKDEDFKNPVDKNLIKQEKDSLKKEEERLMFETLYPGMKDKKINKVEQTAANAQKAKLTDFEWKELMKKEGNLAPEDAKLFEFYENDERRAGIGMKTTFSFRTNPYTEKNITRLDGVNIEEKSATNTNSNTDKEEKEEISDNPYVMKDKADDVKGRAKNSIVNKYIKQYMKDKESVVIKAPEAAQKEIKGVISDNTNSFYEKKKKDKKDKKHSRRSISRSRSNHKHKHKHSKRHDKN